jgi:hypothetical protein
MRKERILPFLLAGAVSMLSADILVAAASNWYMDFLGMLMTLPLYLAHLLLFFNLAVMTRRTRLWDLYLWGCLFALYEAWITKTLWAGSMGAAPGVGTFLGVAGLEFMLLVLFWHPIMSFILPVVTFEALGDPREGMASHVSLLKGRGFLILASLYLLLAFLRCVSSGYDLLIAELPFLLTVLMVFIFFRLATNGNGDFSLTGLVVGRAGTIWLGAFVVALYVAGFILMDQSQRPSDALAYLAIAGAYALFAALLYLRGGALDKKAMFPLDSEDFEKVVVLATVAMLILCIVPIAGALLFGPLVIAMSIGGMALLLLCVADTLRLRTSQRGQKKAKVTSGPLS